MHMHCAWHITSTQGISSSLIGHFFPTISPVGLVGSPLTFPCLSYLIGKLEYSSLLSGLLRLMS